MRISIIVSFRDREIERLKNALKSLSAQTHTDFELIFIDYGSDLEIAIQAKEEVEKYFFAKYFYSHTKGWFWNRAHALNIGTKYAKGDLILFYDIDLVIEKKFLEKISILNYNKKFYTFSCFYLPQNFILENRILEKDGIHYEQNYVGLCAVLKGNLESVKGFDEYYMVWGAEDDDLYRRLQCSGIDPIQFKAIDYLVFHQWHESCAPLKPSLWYLTMVDYMYNFATRSATRFVSGRDIKKEDRLLLNVNEETFHGFKKVSFWENNPMLFFNPFMQEFRQLEPGEKLVIELLFKVEKPQGNFFSSIITRYIKLSENSKNLTRQNITEFFQYFVGVHRPSLRDYYFEVNEVGLKFYFIKS